LLLAEVVRGRDEGTMVMVAAVARREEKEERTLVAFEKIGGCFCQIA